MHKAPVVLVGALAGAALTFLVIQPGPLGIETGVAAPAPYTAETYRELQLFGNVLELVRANYVDKPDDKKLIESAINGMLSSLDPHSNYLDAEEFRNMQAETSGEFGGLGIEITMDDGLIKVVAPIDGTPAAKAGIQANDIITDLDGTPIKGLTIQQAVEKMRGPPHTTIRLTITRNGQAQPIDVELTREIILVPAVQSHNEGGDVGYIRITQFNEHATEGLKQAISDLSRQMPPNVLKGFVIDLRNNPGGLLDQAISVSNAFLSRGEIVSIRGRDADQTQRFSAKPNPGDLIRGKPLILLINGGSASASEIVAGALQDQKRATILGTRSFGKGSVQTIVPLGTSDGALRLTTARYFTPSGRSIQATGITPDIEVLQDAPSQTSAETTSEATLRGHLKAEGPEQKGSQSFVPTDPKEDKALQEALALLRGSDTNPAFPPTPNTALRN